MEGVRPATEGDLPAVVELARSAIAELAAGRGGAVWARAEARQEPVEVGLRSDLADQGAHHAAVVGTVDDTVVGYGISHIEELPDGGRLAVVSDLYVSPEARGIGVGEAVMDALIDHARAAGAIGIDAYALPGDRDTKNFFESFGLKARSIRVHRSLGPAAGPEPGDGTGA